MNSSAKRSGMAGPLAWLGLLALMAGAVARAASPLPALGGPGPAEHHPGKIIWTDLVTPDLKASEAFYSGLFGWTFRTVHAGQTEYAVAVLDGRPIAGLLEKPMPSGEHHQPAWLTFIAAANVDDAETAAVNHGAKSVSPPRTFAGRGRQAVLADPQGAVFAVLASSSGDPKDYLAAPGEWIWSSLLSSDPTQSAAFYKAVFGYDVFDLPGDAEAGHAILVSDKYARASVNLLPPGHRHPHWLNFVRVQSAAEASSKAVTLGGRVLVEPFEDRHGGMIAVIADPLGAPVGLMEWTQGDSKAEPK